MMVKYKKILIYHSNNYQTEIKSKIIFEALLQNSKIKLYRYYNPYDFRYSFSKNIKFKKAIKEFIHYEIHNYYPGNKISLLLKKLFLFFILSFKILFEYISLINKINTVEKLLKFKRDGFEFGKILYNTIYRHNFIPTITEIEKKYKYNFRSFIIQFNYFKILFALNKFDLVIVPDCTYINNGSIPAHFAIKNGIKLIFSSSNDFMKIHNNGIMYSGRDYNLFQKEIFLTNKVKDEIKETLNLKFILGNERESILNYMRTNVYSDNWANDFEFDKTKRNVVVYLHDFYDAFYYSRLELFQDYYSWLKELLDYLNNNISELNINFYFKLHPNSLPDTDSWKISISLINSYNNINFKIINTEISNKQIFQNSPDLIVSMRGTIGFEAPFFGFKCLMLFDNPFVNFDFVKTCSSKSEYFDYLTLKKSIGKINFDEYRNQLHSYYFQNYLNDESKDKVFSEYNKMFSNIKFKNTDIDFFNLIWFEFFENLENANLRLRLNDEIIKRVNLN
jgi:hypothetical protein